jgi:hypothetical protein
MARMPRQAFTMRMYYTQSVAGPTDGGIGVTVKLDSATVESPMMGSDAMKPALDRMRGLTSSIVYDDRMNVVRAEFGHVAGMPSPITEQMGKSIKDMAFPLPEQPVGVGAVTQQGQTSTLRLSGTLTGDRHFSVSRGAPLSSTMGGTMRINVVGGQAGQAGMTMAMEQKTSLQLTERE